MSSNEDSTFLKGCVGFSLFYGIYKYWPQAPMFVYIIAGIGALGLIPLAMEYAQHRMRQRNISKK